MARFSTPLLGLALSLSVLVTGLPMDGLNAPSPDGAMSVDQASKIAFQSLKSAADMMGEMNGLTDDDSQTDDDGNLVLPPSASEIAAVASAQSATPTPAATPSATSHGAASSTAPSATPAHTTTSIKNNPLGNLNIPIIGPLLGGKGL
ncbi:uncharacterized protein BDW47DRAFT_130033 [Aspergillus candidus]|uniref:Uncharacterized protein n=1 Tax=Aspergillus candidus TaxID=41067 RepID=A0A2I2EY92_ASPCN|nr:hypothetical protein BDW47DRAFT_130033 [Aspergillus candidus]PLB33346.1 hypothetical protein BDW47DRAFT_130033 [Aspergillus candidus]